MSILDAIAQGIQSPDEADGRVYGWLPGIVTDVDTKLMRVRARVGKQDDNESTDWLVPVGIGSVESLPEVNDPIGVIFMDGDVHRGAYFYFPQSNTKSRPTEAAMLGSTFIAMYNHLVTQFNQLRLDYNTHTHSFTGTGTVNAPTAPTTAAVGGKGQDSQGSTIAPKSGDQKVLSKRTLVR